MGQLDRSFVIGVISGTIGSVLATLLVFLVRPIFKSLWKRINAPSPLTVQAKVQIAEFLASSEHAMQRLNHMEANPKDLYLYLFQLSLMAILLFVAALLLLLYAPYFPSAQLLPTLGIVFPVLGFIFIILAMVEARNMSAKNIGATRAKLQAGIDDAKAKLGLPLAAIISSRGIAPGAAASNPQSQSRADKFPQS
jgi:hypothetical protein